MIGQIGRPVAVFIDDLDRCDAMFVVELLQNIQTLFRGAPVLYVVAADRNWICTSYEQVYEDFTDNIGDPGKSMGHLFLEKVFQLSLKVPDLSKTVHEVFWEGLIRGADKADTPAGSDEGADASRAITPEKQKEIAAEFAALTKERDVISATKKYAKDPTLREFASAEGFKVMQSPALRHEQQHFLSEYKGLVEKNPRAMKRLLNAYGFRRGFEIQSGIFREGDGEMDALARWIILENRWPVLADHLSPRSAGSGDGALIDALKKDPDVLDVAKGLTWDKLRTIAGAPAQPKG